MIDGIEIPIRTRAGESCLIAAVRAIRQYWPDAVIENGTTGERYQSYWHVPFETLEEIFVYRDARAAYVWDKEGAIPAAYNSMIHLISEEGVTTVVVDDLEGPAIKEMVGAISSALRNDILNIFADH